ncbi:hypothetical protein LXL04_010614 [Taraxacum kok-saghyz]
MKERLAIIACMGQFQFTKIIQSRKREVAEKLRESKGRMRQQGNTSPKKKLAIPFKLARLNAFEIASNSQGRYRACQQASEQKSRKEETYTYSDRAKDRGKAKKARCPADNKHSIDQTPMLGKSLLSPEKYFKQVARGTPPFFLNQLSRTTS